MRKVRGDEEGKVKEEGDGGRGREGRLALRRGQYGVGSISDPEGLTGE